MSQATSTANRPAWVDLATSDAEAARTFYGKLFGWDIEVNPDPQYGGYGIARVDGGDAAGIGPVQSPQQPTTWSLYVGTDDVDALSDAVTAAGGTVVAPPFDVGDQGRMAAFQDPTGALFSAWQGTRMSGFGTAGSNTFAWAELTSSNIDTALPFYERLLGWRTRRSPMPGGPDYVEFQLGDESVAGAWAMSPEQMGGAPSQWMVYFSVDDIDAAFRTAIASGGREVNAPQPYPGGKYAIVTDPQGSTFGLLANERDGG
jgi:predicted enzyme related to lactoylglutathione lyase